MSQLTFFKSSKSQRLKQESIKWMGSLGTPTHALTLNFKRLNPQTRELWSQHKIQVACGIFLKVLNKRIFGHNATKKRACVMSLVVFGKGAYGDHPHAHLAIGKPEFLEEADFKVHVTKAAQLTLWVHEVFWMTEYRDQGWLNYMIEHGLDGLMIDLCSPARP